MKLLASDSKQPRDISAEAADLSALLKNMMEDIGDSSDNNVPVIMEDTALARIIAYEARHSIPIDRGTGLYRDAESWEKDLVKDLSIDELVQITLGANYLMVESLLDVTTQEMGSRIKGKSVEQIRTMFNIVNDFTPEEEEEIKKDHAWATDANILPV